MISQNEESAVRLKNNSSLSDGAYEVASMVALVSWIFGSVAIFKGEYLGFLAPLVSAFVWWLAKLTECFDREDFAVLYTDRFEDPALGKTQKTIHWNQVTSLRWTGSSDGDARLMVYTKEIKTPMVFFVMNLEHLTVEDRLTFMKYIRQAAVDIPQERWSRFCRCVAVPLLKKLERIKEKPAQENQPPPTFRERLYANSTTFPESHPFLAGLLMPITLVLYITPLLSKKVFWTMAAMLAISALVNIRLVWGQWFEPFTTVVLGTAAASFVFGLLSMPRKPQDEDTQESLSTTLVLMYSSYFFIGFPLAMNALEKGWIPRNFAMPILWLILALFSVPIVMILWGEIRKDKRSIEELEEEAVDYWNAKAGAERN